MFWCIGLRSARSPCVWRALPERCLREIREDVVLVQRTGCEMTSHLSGEVSEWGKSSVFLASGTMNVITFASYRWYWCLQTKGMLLPIFIYFHWTLRQQWQVKMYYFHLWGFFDHYPWSKYYFLFLLTPFTFVFPIPFTLFAVTETFLVSPFFQRGNEHMMTFLWTKVFFTLITMVTMQKMYLRKSGGVPLPVSLLGQCRVYVAFIHSSLRSVEGSRHHTIIAQ